MKTQYILLIGLAFFAKTILQAQEVPIKINTEGEVLFAAATNGEPVFLSATNGPRMVHRYLIYQLSIEALTNNSPVNYIISGRVKDNTFQIHETPPQAPVPVFLGSSLHPPILAGVTDARGNFSLRVFLKEDRLDEPMQVVSITNADIYIGLGNIYWGSAFKRQQFDSDLKLTSGLVRKYSIAELLTASQKAKLLP